MLLSTIFKAQRTVTIRFGAMLNKILLCYLESGQPAVPLDRQFMAQELSIDDKKDMSAV